MIKEYDEVGRIYNTPLGKFYSVTTILSWTKDKSFLDRWKARVGEREAAMIVKRAGHSGTNFHLLSEHLLNGTQMEPDQAKLIDQIAKKLFRQSAPILTKNVTETLYTEIELYSNETLRVAGTCDAIVKWNRVLSILDHKSCGMIPRGVDDPFIHDYWIQLALYRIMVSEMFGINCDQLVLLFSAKKQNLARELIIDDIGRINYYNHEACKRIAVFNEILKEKRK